MTKQTTLVPPKLNGLLKTNKKESPSADTGKNTGTSGDTSKDPDALALSPEEIEILIAEAQETKRRQEEKTAREKAANMEFEQALATIAEKYNCRFVVAHIGNNIGKEIYSSYFISK